jgi:hypothetical protein
LLSPQLSAYWEFWPGQKVFDGRIFESTVGQHLKLDAKALLAFGYSQVGSTYAKASLLQWHLPLTRRHQNFEE